MLVTLEELIKAQEDWQIAQQEFMMADPDFVEAAVLKLSAAEKRYNALLRKARKQCIDRACYTVNMTGGDKKWRLFGKCSRPEMK